MLNCSPNDSYGLVDPKYKLEAAALQVMEFHTFITALMKFGLVLALFLLMQ